ncbi:MAG: NAD-dependent epimerase/dehydratase family protein [Verrucomicrobia bacterium]|nr:NAD-dependent epimerase/dehydratase family protein [Verrucomicrobiota bacterium]
MSAPGTAVVTGGAGFIGSHMVDLLLAEGFRVHVIDSLVGGRLQNLEQHKNEVRLKVDERDVRSLAPNDPAFTGAKYVFHFAGIGDIVPSIERPIDYMSTNVMGTVHTLEAARQAGVQKFVYAASSSCYGLAPVPTTEAAPITPEYPYALSKFQGEQAVFHWGKIYKLPVNSIRIFNAYGTRFRTSGAYGSVFGVFLAQKANNKPFTRVGDGNQRRDWVFVTDIARAFYAAATTEKSQEIFNVGTGNPQTVNRLIELLGGEIVQLPKRPGEPDCTWADITKIKRELGWAPRIPLEDGVKIMLANLNYWREAPVWDAGKIEKATKTWFKYLDTKP